MTLALDEPEALPKEGNLRAATMRTAMGTYHIRPFGQPCIEGFFGGRFAQSLEDAGDGALVRGPNPNRTRHRNSMLVTMPWRRQTSAAPASGASDCAHDRELLLVAEATPVAASVVRWIHARGFCQAAFDDRLLSSAAPNTSAYLGAGTGVELRSPVDCQLVGIDQIAPPLQAKARDPMGLGVRPHAHAGPRHRLDMHRPERLDGTAARAAGQLERPPQTALLTLQFGLYLKGFRVDEDA